MQSMLNGLLVVDIDLVIEQSREDCYAVGATWDDTGIHLDDDELASLTRQLQDDGTLDKEYMDYWMGVAEDRADYDR